jgi:hypothetical protein
MFILKIVFKKETQKALFKNKIWLNILNKVTKYIFEFFFQNILQKNETFKTYNFIILFKRQKNWISFLGPFHELN